MAFNWFKKENEETAENNAAVKKHYLSGKEVREIAKANQKEMRRLEKEKNRKADPSEYTTEMKDDGNILEVDGLHSYFFTDQGVVKAVNGVTFSIPARVGALPSAIQRTFTTSERLMFPSGSKVSADLPFTMPAFAAAIITLYLGCV